MMYYPPHTWLWPEDNDRHVEASVRYRIARHLWEKDLIEFTETLKGEVNLAALGIVDFSCNPLAALGKQLSTPGVYGDTPDVYPPPGGDALIDAAPGRGGGQEGYLQRAGWAALMPLVDYCVRTLECVALVPTLDMRYLDHPSGPLSLRLAYPHAMHVEVHPDRPTEALVLWEARYWQPPGAPGAKPTDPHAVWYRWDVSNPDAPRFDVYDEGGERNITDLVFPGATLSGDAYPWRYSAGTGAPFIPHTFYRLSKSEFWGYGELKALHRGTLHAAVSVSMGHYATQTATSNPHIAINCSPKGAANTQSPLQRNGIRVLPLMPGAILEMEQDADGMTAQVIPAGPGIDPSIIYRAVGDYVAQLLADYGLSGKSSTRDHANPTSAAALSIHDSDKRREQRRGVEAYRLSDEETFAKCAALLSAALGGAPIPERGYRTVYHLLPLTPDEGEEQRADLAFRLEHKLASRVDAYMEQNPGADRKAAIEHLRRVQRDTEALDVSEDRTEAADELREALTRGSPEELREAAAEALAILDGGTLPDLGEE